MIYKSQDKFATYQDIKTELDKFATAHGIALTWNYPPTTVVWPRETVEEIKCNLELVAKAD